MNDAGTTHKSANGHLPTALEPHAGPSQGAIEHPILILGSAMVYTDRASLSRRAIGRLLGLTVYT